MLRLLLSLPPLLSGSTTFQELPPHSRVFVEKEIAAGRKMPVGYHISGTELGRAREEGTVDAHNGAAISRLMNTMVSLQPFLAKETLEYLTNPGEDKMNAKGVSISQDVLKLTFAENRNGIPLHKKSQQRMFGEGHSWHNIARAVEKGSNLANEYNDLSKGKENFLTDEELKVYALQSVPEDLVYYLDVVDGGLDNVQFGMQVQLMIEWFDFTTMLGDSTLWAEDIQDMAWSLKQIGVDSWKPSVEDSVLRNDPAVKSLIATLVNVEKKLEVMDQMDYIEGDADNVESRHIEFIMMRASILEGIVEVNPRLLLFREPTKLMLSYIQLFGQMFGNFHALPPHKVHECSHLPKMVDNMILFTRRSLLMLDLPDPLNAEEKEPFQAVVQLGRDAIKTLELIKAFYASAAAVRSQKGLRTFDVFPKNNGNMFKMELEVTTLTLQYVTSFRQILQLHGEVYEKMYTSIQKESDFDVSTEGNESEGTAKDTRIVISKYYLLGRLHLLKQTKVLTTVEKLELGAFVLGQLSTVTSLQKELKGAQGVKNPFGISAKSLEMVLQEYLIHAEESFHGSLTEKVNIFCRKVGVLMGMWVQLKDDQLHPNHASDIEFQVDLLYSKLAEVEKGHVISSVDDSIKHFDIWRGHLNEPHDVDDCWQRAKRMLLKAVYPDGTQVAWKLEKEEIDVSKLDISAPDLEKKLRKSFEKGQIYLGQVEATVEALLVEANTFDSRNNPHDSVLACGRKKKDDVKKEAQMQTLELASHANMQLMNMQKDVLRRNIVSLLYFMFAIADDIARGVKMEVKGETVINPTDWDNLKDMALFCLSQVKFLSEYEHFLESKGLFEELRSEDGASEIILEWQLGFFKDPAIAERANAVQESTPTAKMFARYDHRIFQKLYGVLKEDWKSLNVKAEVASGLHTAAVDMANAVFGSEAALKFSAKSSLSLPDIPEAMQPASQPAKPAGRNRTGRNSKKEEVIAAAPKEQQKELPKVEGGKSRDSHSGLGERRRRKK